MDVSAFFAPPPVLGAKRALCVQPHPDDNEIGMGGTVARLAAEGCEVHYLTVTNGDLGLFAPGMTHETLAAVRREESRAAGERLGVRHFHAFNLPDGSLSDVPSLAGRIAEVIRTVQPDVIFCPDPWVRYEAHWDHIVTGLATAQAFTNCTLIHYPRGTETLPWLCPAIAFYYTQSPNTAVDVAATFEAKFEAMALHRSQLNEEQLGMYRLYFTLRGQKLGAPHGMALAEGFKALSGLHLHCFAEAPEI